MLHYAKVSSASTSSESLSPLVASARKLMETEAEAILSASHRLEESLPRAVETILERIGTTNVSGRQPRGGGKLVVTGIGKSGHVARKIVATLQSTGTPAAFLHPAEAAHGDLGLCQPGDPVLMFSKSGTTAELAALVAPLREFDSPFVGILGNPASPLAAEMNVVLDASVQREADPEGYLPTASSAVALAVGHALVVTLMQARGFTAADFSRLHNGGQLGRSLKVRVREAMHQGEEVAWVSPEDSLKHVVIQMSRRPLGAACVVDRSGKLAGLVTDGDVRRALEAHDDIRTLQVADVMTRSPLTIGPEALLNDALLLMENRPSQISVLPVADAAGRCLGLLRLHDVYQPQQS